MSKKVNVVVKLSRADQRKTLVAWMPYFPIQYLRDAFPMWFEETVLGWLIDSVHLTLTEYPDDNYKPPSK